jgi:hypothetical protein
LYATDPGFSTSPIADSDSDGSIEFTVQPPYNSSSTNERAARLDFSVTLDGQSRTLPIFLHQAAVPYIFSEDGATLTLFSNFPHGTKLDGMNTANIPELADPTTAAKVTNLVIKGDFDPSHILGIQDRQSTLSLSSLESISLPDFTGTVPGLPYDPNDLIDEEFMEFLRNNTPFFEAAWLKNFDAPHAVGIGMAAFFMSGLTSFNLPEVQDVEWAAFAGAALTTVYLPVAKSIGSAAFNGCVELITVNLPVAESIEETAFHGCVELTSVDLPEAENIGVYAFEGCVELTTVNLPVAESIGNGAFQECVELTSIDLPAAKSIGENVFYECPLLNTLKLGYAGEIALLGEYRALFGGSQNESEGIDLFLHADHMDEVTGEGKVWGGYTWNSITQL